MRIFWLFVAALLALSSAASAQQSVWPWTGADSTHTAPVSNSNPMPSTNQALSSAAVTPSDSTVLSPPTRAVFNGAAAACNIAMKLQNDTAAVTHLNVQPGEVLPVQAKVILNTGTTCTNIVAWF